MAEYIEREALLLRIDCYGTNKFGMLDEDIRAFIKAQPAADVAPVVHTRWAHLGGDEWRRSAQRCTEVTAMRLIDRDAIHWRPDENWELYATAADIRAIPTVDAVVVTRCKDCKYLVNATVNDNGFLICGISDMEIAPDDFCSYGEPKEGTHADDHD